MANGVFAQVILPIPIYKAFTYSIPEEYVGHIQIGSRVLVNFGKRKIYTGIVADVTEEFSDDYEVKPLIMPLDETPILNFPQLKLWSWISEYYLCSPGEVMKAALPSGLKVESETYVSLNKDFESDGSIKFNDRETALIAFLEAYKRIRISDIEKENLMSNVRQTITALLDKEVLIIDEQVVTKYVSKKVSFIKLNCDRNDNIRLKDYFQLVSKSRKQESLLLSYIDLSGWLKKDSIHEEVEKQELLKRADVSAAILKNLIDKGVFLQTVRDVNRFTEGKTNSSKMSIPVLSPAQASVKDQIITLFDDKNVCLLRGVTGSGKTEIYCTLIQENLSKGKQVLYLVPEISLTTQLTSRLKDIFKERLIVYHSKFTDNERVDIWKKLRDSDEPYVILGVRSSVFLPFSNLGLVIVDEEHDPSYKQYDPAPRYNARDTAIVLASYHYAKVLLGTATPSIETYYKAMAGKYGLVELLERYHDVDLPDVEIIDMKEQRMKKSTFGNSMFSKPLIDSLKTVHSHGGQSILFRNRRGFAPVVVCSQCGWTPKCPNCDVSPVLHKRTEELKCHYCGHTMRMPKVCPACGENAIETYGYGTERIEEQLSELLPEYSIGRMDLDTTRNKNSHEKIIDDFSNHKTEILVGTQMVTKGLDFENVNLVGVLNADTLLNFPDFRSDERAFNMLEQVAGRAGRHHGNGRVLIQTTDSKNEVLKYVAKHDYKSFFDIQIREREKYGYPPFTKVINVYLKHKDENTVRDVSVMYAIELKRIFGSRVFGPEKPFVSRISSYYMQQVMLKIESNASMKKVKQILRQVFEYMAQDARFKSVIIYYDVDPV